MKTKHVDTVIIPWWMSNPYSKNFLYYDSLTKYWYAIARDIPGWREVQGVGKTEISAYNNLKMNCDKIGESPPYYKDMTVYPTGSLDSKEIYLYKYDGKVYDS